MFITNDLRWDGFGAQFQSIIWSILWAEVKGLQFVYSEVERMVNDIGDEKKFIKQANDCMNLHNKYPPVLAVPHGAVIFALKWPYFYKEIEADINTFHNHPSFKRIQDYYFANKTNPFDLGYRNIAVHVRRPLSFDNRAQGTGTPDKYFLDCMATCMASASQEKPIRFHLYSNGRPEDFEDYKKFPVQLHLEDDTFMSFVGMTFSDILITSASSFSYTAALLSKGEVIYLPFWHPPRAHWKALA